VQLKVALPKWIGLDMANLIIFIFSKNDFLKTPLNHTKISMCFFHFLKKICPKKEKRKKANTAT